MNSYNLKDKIHITKDFLSELTSKSWQEIEHLQNQISNIETATEQDKALVKLLDTLLTSYYIFIGGLENLETNDSSATADNTEVSFNTHELPKEITTYKNTTQSDIVDNITPILDDTVAIEYEPFEYFVDFDEPIGDPISDDDLYGN